MTAHPSIIGRAGSALTAPTGSGAHHGQLIAQITGTRKPDNPDDEAAITELTTAGLLQPRPATTPHRPHQHRTGPVLERHMR